MGKVCVQRCPVPGCGRKWSLSGPRQGFVSAGVNRHIGACRLKYHRRQGHPGDAVDLSRIDQSCTICLELRQEGHPPDPKCMTCSGSGKEWVRAMTGPNTVGDVQKACFCTMRTARELLGIEPGMILLTVKVDLDAKCSACGKPFGPEEPRVVESLARPKRVVHERCRKKGARSR